MYVAASRNHCNIAKWEYWSNFFPLDLFEMRWVRITNIWSPLQCCCGEVSNTFLSTTQPLCV